MRWYFTEITAIHVERLDRLNGTAFLSISFKEFFHSTDCDNRGSVADFFPDEPIMFHPRT